MQTAKEMLENYVASKEYTKIMARSASVIKDGVRTFRTNTMAEALAKGANHVPSNV